MKDLNDLFILLLAMCVCVYTVHPFLPPKRKYRFPVYLRPVRPRWPVRGGWQW